MLPVVQAAAGSIGAGVETGLDTDLGQSIPGGGLAEAGVPSAARGSIEISMFVPRMADDPPQPSVPVRPPWKIARVPPGWVSCRLPGRALSGGVCALATLLAHAMLLAPFFQGAAGASGGAGLRTSHEDSDRLEVRIIEENNAVTSDSLRQPPLEPLLTPVSLSFPLQRDRPPVQAVNHGTAEGKERPTRGTADRAPTGTYLEQITELIDRLWLRPQIAIGAPEFACRVRIDQSPSGQIENVAVEECDRNVRWRLSLITAIRFASKLPVPADPAQFQSTLHIEFKSASLPGRRF